MRPGPIDRRSDDARVARSRVDPSALRVLMRRWLANKRDETKHTYRGDLADFASWAGFEHDDEALAWLLSKSPPDINAVVLGYREDLLTRDVGRRRPGLAPSTINRRLSALRSFTKIARTVGYTTATIEIEGVPSRKYRDTSGVPHADYIKMLHRLEEQAEESPKAARDALVIRLLHDVGLRRAEVRRIDVRDLDQAKRTIFVLGKTEDVVIEVAEDVWWAIDTWMEHRGHEPGALITTSRVRPGGVESHKPVNVSTINRIVTDAGLAVEVEGARPHGFRHSGATELLDQLGGDIRRAASWTRHRDINTVQIYDDNRRKDVRSLQAMIAAPHPRRKR